MKPSHADSVRLEIQGLISVLFNIKWQNDRNAIIAESDLLNRNIEWDD